MPADIQIAFQGGGAKFIAMLPIAEAFQASQIAGKINIKAVSGTSAGALCAALLAADCNFKELKTYLIAAGPNHVENLMGPDYQQLRHLVDSKWYAKLPALLSSASVLKNLYYEGTPILQEAEFGVFLDKILSFCAKGNLKIEQLLPKKLSIIATNLTEGTGFTYTSGSLKSALRDSCALPLAFRSFAALTTNHHVDGGLCDNLPIDSLMGDVTAPIFAVFPEETGDPAAIKSLYAYMLALFSAAIENNVKRAKSNISEAFRVPVKAGYSTFGFKEALEQLSNTDWYDRILNETKNRLADFSNNYGILQSTNQIRFTDTNTKNDYAAALERISQDYDEHCDHESAQLIVRMNCAERLTETSDTTNRPAENIRKIARLRVKSGNFRYFRSAAVGAGHASVWKAYNVSKESEIPIRVLSLEIPFQYNTGCLVEFVDAEKWISEGDEIAVNSIHYEKDVLKLLNMGKPDFLGVSNPHKHTIGKTEIILMYPMVLGSFDMKLNTKMSNVDSSSVERFDPKLGEFDDEYWGVIGMRCNKLPTNGKFYCTVNPEVWA
jgi:predicted acylesterase/phospholipase RssA